MRFLSTLLAATLVCAALLAVAGYHVGDPRTDGPRTGLTAATILGTDGLPSAAATGTSDGLDRKGLGILVGETAGMPAGRDG